MNGYERLIEVAEKIGDLIIIGNGDTSEYALRAIVSLRGLSENEVVVIKGRGEFIEKAIDVYNEMKARMGESLKLVKVNIGSERVGRRIFPYIEIKVKI
ncbi:MAG: DNA-binding protein [Fervidicoccaceae archaeon]